MTWSQTTTPERGNHPAQRRSFRPKSEMEDAMTTNVGSIDRVLRVLIGVALLAFALFSGHTYAWIGYIGVVPLLTAAIGWCPLYAMLGVSTCPARRSGA